MSKNNQVIIMGDDRYKYRIELRLGEVIINDPNAKNKFTSQVYQIHKYVFYEPDEINKKYYSERLASLVNLFNKEVYQQKPKKFKLTKWHEGTMLYRMRIDSDTSCSELWLDLNEWSTLIYINAIGKEPSVKITQIEAL